MSKSGNQASETNGNQDSDILKGATLVAPSGARRIKTSTDGFWDEECGTDEGKKPTKYPLHCKVLFGREVVPTSGPSKGKKRHYAVVELLAPTMLKERKGDNASPARAAKKGEVIAVWLTPGLDDLRQLAGAEVWVCRYPKSEWKDTGKGNPMKTYDIQYISGSRKPLQIVPFTNLDKADSDKSETVTSDEIPF